MCVDVYKSRADVRTDRLLRPATSRSTFPRPVAGVKRARSVWQVDFDSFNSSDAPTAALTDIVDSFIENSIFLSDMHRFSGENHNFSRGSDVIPEIRWTLPGYICYPK